MTPKNEESPLMYVNANLNNSKETDRTAPHYQMNPFTHSEGMEDLKE
jgi:hypothetical protein